MDNMFKDLFGGVVGVDEETLAKYAFGRDLGMFNYMMNALILNQIINELKIKLDIYQIREAINSVIEMFVTDNDKLSELENFDIDIEKYKEETRKIFKAYSDNNLDMYKIME